MADKVVRDGKVAVLYSPGFGAGWYSWNQEKPECLTHPRIVALVEAREPITEEVCEELFGEDFYSGGASKLKIMWVLEGDQIMINEYDGSESVKVRSCDEGWVTV